MPAAYVMTASQVLTMPDASTIDPAAILQRVDEIEAKYLHHHDSDLAWLCQQLRTALADTRRVDESSQEQTERAARAICDAWGYDWDCEDPSDSQACGDDFNLFDERPSKALFRRAAKAALDATMAATPRED